MDLTQNKTGTSNGEISEEQLQFLDNELSKNKEEIKRYQEVSNNNIVYESIPDFRKVSSYFATRSIIKKKESK